MRGAPFAVAALICLFLAGPAAAQYDPLPAGMRADAPAGDASVTARPVLKVALLSYSPPWYDASFTDETIRFLAWKMPQYRFKVTWLEAENFNKTLAKGEADIVAAPTALLQLQSLTTPTPITRMPRPSSPRPAELTSPPLKTSPTSGWPPSQASFRPGFLRSPRNL